MKKVIKLSIKLVLISFFMHSVAFADMAPKRKRIVNVIDMELKELSRLSRVSGNKDPEMLLRIAELYLEKGRIVREQENEDFFNLSIKKRQNLNRDKFYAKSKKLIKQAQKTGVYILNTFRSFKDKSDIYYILAFNEKENVDYKKAKSLFIKSIKTSRSKKSGAGVKSRLALADIYYGEGNFRKAKSYYDGVINTIKDDKWYTKYLYNLGWSNFRLGNKKLAIRQMKSVHTLSKSNKYVDKGRMASRDLGFFYADSGSVKKAKRFYTSVGGNVAKSFYDMGLFLKDKQKYSKSLSMFKSAYNAGDNEFKVKSLIQLLSIYDKYGNDKNFVIYARKARNLKMNKDDRKEVLFFVSKRAALLQKDLNQSHNKNRPSILKRKATNAAELYYISQELDPSLKEKSLFYAAESNYAAGEYSRALKFYDEVRQMRNTKDKFFVRSIVGMLVVVNEKGLSKKKRKQYFESVYVDYIKIENNMAKKGKAVEKLFAYLIDEEPDPKRAEKIFFQYAKYYPTKLGKNEAMIGRIVDLYKQQKKKDELLSFVKRLKTTGVRLTSKFVNRLNKIVLTTQFASVQKANKKGDKKYALKGYLLIYKDKESTVEARRNAAYNIAVLFYELGNMRLMNLWLERSISEMSVQEIVKFSSSFSLMVKELYLRQRYELGARRTEQLLSKTCLRKVKNKDDLFSNYLVMQLGDKKDSDALRFFNEQSSCRYSKGYKKKSVETFIDYFVENRQVQKSEQFYSMLKRYTRNRIVKMEYLGAIMALKRSMGISPSVSNTRELNSLFRATKNKASIPIDAIDEYAFSKIETVNKRVRAFEKVKLQFPEKKYNATLQKKFRDLDRITLDLINILKVGSGKAMVKTYVLLIDSYSSFAKEVENFTPPGSKEYVSSFKQSMKSISGSLFQKVQQFEKELNIQVNKNNVLSIDYGMKKRSNIPYSPAHEAVIMDKRGM